MIDVYLCDDNKQELDYYSKIIEDYLLFHSLNETIICAVQTPDELLEALIKPAAGLRLYFLDINLNADKNGLQLASEIRKRDPLGEIVFITSKSEMACLTFDYQIRALDFILKDRIDILPQKIKSCLNAACKKEKQLNELITEPVYLKLNGERVCFNPDDILYIETDKDAVHKICIYTITGVESIYSTLKEMDNALNKYTCFCRCNKSIIINKKHIRKIDLKEKAIYLDSGAIIPVSNRYLRSLRNE